MWARVFLIAPAHRIGVNCLVIHRYYNLAQLQSCLDGWDIELIQLAAERAGGVARCVSLPSLKIVWLQAGRPIVIRGNAPTTVDCLIFCSSPSVPARWLGEPLDTRRFAVTGRRARVDVFLPADATLCIITVQWLAGMTAKRMQLRAAAPDCVSHLLRFIESVASNEATTNERTAAQAIDDALAERIAIAMETSEIVISRMSARSLRASAVERACRYIESSLARSVSLADLSRHCGVGVRTLEYGFRQFYDTTPISFIKSQRLTRTHTELARACTQLATISKIAKRAGFTHMGQYCQDYRALFGESPSMTLQRALGPEQLCQLRPGG